MRLCSKNGGTRGRSLVQSNDLLLGTKCCKICIKYTLTASVSVNLLFCPSLIHFAASIMTIMTLTNHVPTNPLSLISHSASISIHPSFPPSKSSNFTLVAESASTSLLSVILPPLVSIFPLLQLSSSPAFLDTSRVTWTFQIGVSTRLSTSLFFSYFSSLWHY